MGPFLPPLALLPLFSFSLSSFLHLLFLIRLLPVVLLFPPFPRPPPALPLFSFSHSSLPHLLFLILLLPGALLFPSLSSPSSCSSSILLLPLVLPSPPFPRAITSCRPLSVLFLLPSPPFLLILLHFLFFPSFFNSSILLSFPFTPFFLLFSIFLLIFFPFFLDISPSLIISPTFFILFSSFLLPFLLCYPFFFFLEILFTLSPPFLFFPSAPRRQPFLEAYKWKLVVFGPWWWIFLFFSLASILEQNSTSYFEY